MLQLSRLTLESSTTDSDDTTTLVFRPDQPLAFSAGQHALWRIPGGGAVRPFTIASAPEDETIDLGTNLTSATPLKRTLAALRPGDRTWLLGPLGGFVLPDDQRPSILLAQGLGITPFRSMLRHTAQTGRRTDITLVHVGTVHPYRSETEPLVTASSYPLDRGGFATEVTRAVQRHTDAAVLVSGSPDFVSRTKTLLQRLGVARGLIRADRFWGYHAPHAVPAVPATGREVGA